MESSSWSVPQSPRSEISEDKNEDDIIARIHVRGLASMGELKEEESPVKKKKTGFCRAELKVESGEVELRVWLAQVTSVRVTHVVVAGKYIEVYLGPPPRLASPSPSSSYHHSVTFSYGNNTPIKLRREASVPKTPKGGLRVALPRTPPPPPVPKPVYRTEIPGDQFLDPSLASVAYRRTERFTQLFTLSVQVPLLAAPPSTPSVCLQPFSPLLVCVVPIPALSSLLDKGKAAGPQGLGVLESSLVDAAYHPLNHPFQRVMDDVHAWAQIANLFHAERKRMGTVLTDVNGNKYIICAHQVEDVVVIVFSVVALWQTFDDVLSMIEETPTPRSVYDKLPPRCFMWPDRPEQGYSGPYFKDVQWSECAPPCEPIWSLVASNVQPDIFIRLLLALLLDVSVLVHSKDPWLLLQTLEAVRALRLPPCPIECYFPIINSELALERILSPTAVVLGCLTEDSFNDLGTILREVSTCILVIDLEQPISKQMDEKLLSVLESSACFRSTHSDVGLALRPLNFVLNPKKCGLLPTLYSNLFQACVTAQDPHGGGFSLVKDAFGNILADVLSFSPWWTCAADTVSIAENLDLSSSPSYLDSSFALTHAFAQWKSFSKRYLGDSPICNVRPGLIRARSLISANSDSNATGSERKKKSLKPNEVGVPSTPPSRAHSVSPSSHSHHSNQPPEEITPPHQLLVGEQGVYLKFHNEGFTRTNHRMTLEQSSLLKISHLLIESLPKLTSEPECRMVIGNPTGHEDTFNNTLERSPKAGSPVGTLKTKMPQPPKVRVYRANDSGEIKVDPERSSGSVITHSDLVGGVGNSSVIIGNVLAEEGRQRSEAIVCRDVEGNAELNVSVENDSESTPDLVRITSGKCEPEESPSKRGSYNDIGSSRGSVNGVNSGSSSSSSSSNNGDSEKSSGRGSSNSTRSQSLTGTSETPASTNRRSSSHDNQWYSFLSPHRSSIENKARNSSSETKIPPCPVAPPPPPVLTHVAVPPIRTESGFLGFRRSPKAGQDPTTPRHVVPLQRGRNSSRSPGQWLEDPRSNVATGLDLAVPLKYAGLLLRAIEADSINQREGSKKKQQEASKNRLLRALELSRSGSNSPVAEENTKIVSTPRRVSPRSSRIFDESDRTPRRGNFKTPSPNGNRRFQSANSGGGLTPSSSCISLGKFVQEDAKNSSTDDDSARAANGRVDEDNVVSNVWSNLDALHVGIDGQPQLLIPKFRSSEVIFDEEIARGSEGSIVFRGHLTNGKTVAIKVAKAQAVGEEENGFDTLSEAYYLLSLKARKNDIAVVTCLGVVASCPPNFQIVMPCLVLEWCETSLAKMVSVVDVHWASLLVRVGLCIQLTQAVLDVHENGVIHRDLRPEHVLITEHKTVVLTDFGLAESTTTPRFIPLRTPAYYRAPELECSNYLDTSPQPADVFALGKIFSVIIAKQLPSCEQTDLISCKIFSRPLHSLIEQCTRPFGLFHAKRLDVKQILTELLDIERDLIDQEIKFASHNTHNDPALYVQGIARAMRMCPTLRLHEKACHALGNVQLTLVSAPAILNVLTKEEPRIVKGCEEVKFFSDSLYLACNILFGLLASSGENAKRLFEAGCTDLARAVLANGTKLECPSRDSHTNRFLKLHSQFASKGCNQLDKLVASSVQHVMLAHGGCTEVLLVALKLFPRSCDVQLPAFAALAELSVELDTCAILLQHLDLFVSVMKIHLSVAYVQEHACKILRSLASPSNLPKLAKAGCMELIITAMRAHSPVAALQTHACAVIKEFIVVAEHRAILLSKGCVDLILLAMKTHQRTASVQFWGSGTLSVLAAYPETKKKLLNFSTMEALFTAMETHPGDCTVQQNTLGALSRLVPSSNGRIRSDSEGDSTSPKPPFSGRMCREVPLSPTSPLRVPRKDPILRPSPLSREDSTNVVAFRCLDLLLLAFKNHSSNAGVVRTLCGAIKSWGGTSGNKAYLKQNACDDLLKQALKQHESLKTEIGAALAVLV